MVAVSTFIWPWEELAGSLAVVKLIELHTWEEVSKAATVANACIRPGGHNHDKAYQTWLAFAHVEPRRVRYYGIYEDGTCDCQTDILRGYVRVLRITESEHTTKPTWIADYCSPFSYEAISLLLPLLPGTLLAPERASPLSDGWVRLHLAIPQLDRYPWHQVQSSESTRLVVMP